MGKAVLYQVYFLKVLWPMEKGTLEQVHTKVMVAVGKSVLQQVYS